MTLNSPSSRLDDQAALSPWLLPAVLFSAVIVLLSGMASLGLPFRSLLPWLSLSLLAAAIVGARYYRSPGPGIAWGFAFLSAWCVVVECSGLAIPLSYVSSHPDAWSYGAMADYLADYGRLKEQGMPIADQFSSHLRNTRFSSGCILALFETILPGKFHAHTAFYFSAVFVGFTSMVAFAESLGFNLRWSLITAGGTTTFGWTTNAIVIGNYDNLLFAALLPSGLSLILQLGHSPRNFGAEFLALSTIGSAIIYTYPEGLALVGPAFLPAIIYSIWYAREKRRAILRLLCAGSLATILSLPYLGLLLRFVVQQLNSSAGTRPGADNFSGLLTNRFLPSAFSLGTEHPNVSASWWILLASCVLLFFVAVGVVQLNKQHRWFALASALMFCLLIWQLVFRQYDYGAYKVLYCHSWLIIPALVAGGQNAVAWFGPGLGAALLLGLAVLAGGERWHQRGYRAWPPLSDTNALTDLRQLRHLSRGAAILIDVHNATDQQWALSFLRGEPLILSERKGYLAMPHVQPFLDKAAHVQSGNEIFVLRDSRDDKAVWRSGRFSFSRLDGATISRIENPNGLETVNGQPFIWLAHSAATTFHIHAVHSGKFTLAATSWIPGPSLPDIWTRSVGVTDALGTHVELIDTSHRELTINLKEGLNEIKLQILESPSLFLQPNGDRRELMLGIQGYLLRPSSF